MPRLTQWSRYLSLALVLLILAACAAPPRIGGTDRSSAFERSGRFAVTVVGPDGTRDAVQGGFAWQDSGDQLRVDLVNPLGNTLAQVLVEPGQASLRRSDGSVEVARDADGLLAQVLGSAIPVEGLRDWLRGRAAEPDPHDVDRDAEGRITALRQYGWQVSLSRYDGEGPRVLHLERRHEGDHITVRLVIDSP